MIYIALLLLSFTFTAYLRWYALKTNRMDIPNERSSHSLPTPRGGGLSFVLCFLIGLVGIYFKEGYILRLMYSLLILGSGTAALGWLDDRYQLSASLRLSFQLCLATMACWQLGFQHTDFFILEITIATLYLAWMINMFNFMDGIDGYAVMEALFLSGSLYFLTQAWMPKEFNSYVACLFVSVLGFGLWNFPKARIFMGDVGSGFLGGILAVCSLFILFYQPAFFVSWLILTALFMVDSGLTLATRVLRGERFWMAHRQHAYQHLTQAFGSHVWVTLGGLVINLLWLLPLAWSTQHQQMNPWFAVSLAYLPLLGIGFYCRAGRPAKMV